MSLADPDDGLYELLMRGSRSWRFYLKVIEDHSRILNRTRLFRGFNFTFFEISLKPDRPIDYLTCTPVGFFKRRFYVLQILVFVIDSTFNESLHGSFLGVLK